MMSKTVANPTGLARLLARAAALGLLALAATFVQTREAHAQWTQPDVQGNINNTNSGNVGVGTTSPQSSLHVSTSSTAAGARGIIDEQTSNDANGSLLIVRKSRAGASVLNGDAIGNFYAQAFDGSSWTSGGRIRFVVDGAVAAGSVPTGLEFLTGTNNTAPLRMKITSGGNVGVNIAAPTATFHVFGLGGASGAAAPTAFNATGGAGGNSASAGGAGGDLQLFGGAGGWNTTGSSLHFSGPGGGISLTGGTGGQHLFGVNNAGAGGAVSLTGGTGGAHNVSGFAGGLGGNVFLNGGAGGTGTSAGAAGNVILANQRGNVGIGTATPTYRLDVLGGASRNTLALTGDGDTVGFAGIRIGALTTTGIATNRSAAFHLHMRKDSWYGGDGSGPSFIIESISKTGGFAAPFMIAPNNDIIMNSGTGVSGMSVGRVGIGTAAPAYKLDVQGGQVNASGGLCIAGDCKTAWSQVGGGGTSSQWTTNGTSIHYNSGNVGLGTTTPGYRFDVQGGQVNAAGGLCIAGDCKTAWSQVGGVSQWTTAGSGINYTGGNVGIGIANANQRLGVQGMVGLYPQAWTPPSGRGMFMFHGGTGGAIYAFNYPAGTPDPIGLSAETFDFNTYVGGSPQQRMFISNAGNIGIGTGAPGMKLHVFGGNVMHQWSGTSGQEYGFYTATNNNHFSSNLYYDGQWRMLSNGRGSTVVAAPQSGAALLLLADNNPRLPGSVSSLSTLMHVTMDGKVGINTGAPATALHVVGDVTVTGNIAAKYQDVAEWVPSTQELKAGTVVVLDGARANHVLASSQAYDTRVAGVVSAQPGVILGEAGAGKLMVATTGRVKVRVDATRAPVRIGDLLVTSDVEGVAMKSQPVNIGGRPFHSPGTLIGKALESLETGVGEILVLLSLQ